LRGLASRLLCVQAGHQGVEGALGAFDFAHQHLAFVAGGLHAQHLGALLFQLVRAPGLRAGG
jgi:hypothetical protein